MGKENNHKRFQTLTLSNQLELTFEKYLWLKMLKTGTGLFGIAVIAAVTDCSSLAIPFPVGQKVCLCNEWLGH